MWRSFNFDENVETPDTYVTRIRQVVRLLSYEEPQVLEVFKNTVPNRLYWVLFPNDNLCKAVETAKRFLTKEKIDRPMTGQSSTPSMKLTDKKRKTVSFDTRDVLERNSENMEWITALTDKMYIKLNQKEAPYEPQIYQKRGRVQNWQTFRQSNNQRGNRSFSRECSYDSNRGYGRGRGNFRGGGFLGRTSNNFSQNESRNRNREDRRSWRQSRSRERRMRDRSESISRSSSRTSINRDRAHCFKCREYDHFANECPNLVPNDSDRESDGVRSASLQILADSDTSSEVEQYLNI